jgi:hypothetical protein
MLLDAHFTDPRLDVPNKPTCYADLDALVDEEGRVLFRDLLKVKSVLQRRVTGLLKLLLQFVPTNLGTLPVTPSRHYLSAL